MVSFCFSQIALLPVCLPLVKSRLFRAFPRVSWLLRPLPMPFLSFHRRSVTEPYFKTRPRSSDLCYYIAIANLCVPSLFCVWPVPFLFCPLYRAVPLPRWVDQGFAVTLLIVALLFQAMPVLSMLSIAIPLPLVRSTKT